MNVVDLNYTDSNMTCKLLANNNEDQSELIRVAELLNDFIRKDIAVMRPYAMRLNGVGHENITSAQEQVVEPIVEIIYKMTKFNYKCSSASNKKVKIEHNGSTLTYGEFKDALSLNGIDSTISYEDSKVFIHTLGETITMEILFDTIEYGETDVLDVLYKNNINKEMYYPLFITSNYGMMYKFLDDNTLEMDLDVYIEDCEQLVRNAIKNIEALLALFTP